MPSSLMLTLKYTSCYNKFSFSMDFLYQLEKALNHPRRAPNIYSNHTIIIKINILFIHLDGVCEIRDDWDAHNPIKHLSCSVCLSPRTQWYSVCIYVYMYGMPNPMPYIQNLYNKQFIGINSINCLLFCVFRWYVSVSDIHNNKRNNKIERKCS